MRAGDSYARPAAGQAGTTYSFWKRAKKETKMTCFQDEYVIPAVHPLAVWNEREDLGRRLDWFAKAP